MLDELERRGLALAHEARLLGREAHERGLADTRLAAEDESVAASLPRNLEQTVHAGPLGSAAHSMGRFYAAFRQG